MLDVWQTEAAASESEPDPPERGRLAVGSEHLREWSSLVANTCGHAIFSLDRPIIRLEECRGDDA